MQSALVHVLACGVFGIVHLIGITPLAGTRWRLEADLMTARGPALGTQFDFSGKELFGIPNKYEGIFKAYGIWDTGLDVDDLCEPAAAGGPGVEGQRRGGMHARRGCGTIAGICP